MVQFNNRRLLYPVPYPIWLRIIHVVIFQRLKLQWQVLSDFSPKTQRFLMSNKNFISSAEGCFSGTKNSRKNECSNSIYFMKTMELRKISVLIAYACTCILYFQKHILSYKYHLMYNCYLYRTCRYHMLSLVLTGNVYQHWHVL